MNVLGLVPYLYDTAPGQRFRIEQWARILERQGVRIRFEPFESERLRQIVRLPGHHQEKFGEIVRCIRRRIRLLAAIDGAWDAVFVYREILPIGPPILERMMARRGLPIVYDFDDAIFLPDVSEANRHFKWLKWPRKVAAICRLSAFVIVGNRYLEEFASRHARRVSVVPSTIDTQSYTPKGDPEIRGVPTIGWSGSLTTLKHLRTLGPTLRTLRRSVEFRLKVVGSPEYSVPGLEVESQGWSAASEIDDVRSFDIGIMPLPDDAWSRGKCGLKALLYMAAGVPTVAAAVGMNCEIIRDGENGFLASTEQEWVEKLSRLIADGDLRRMFSREGRKTVEGWYSADVQAPRLLEILNKVRNGSRQPTGW